MNVEMDLQARKDVPLWLAYGAPVFTIAAALGVGALALQLSGVSPLEAYSVLFIQTLTTEFGTTETVITAIPLILTGLAVYLPLKAGLFNIGAEGQLLLGALAGTWVGVSLSLPGIALVPLMLIAGAVAGAFWAFIPAWLRAKWDVNEIITSLLLTFVAVDIQNYLLRGPLQGGQGNFPQSAPFSPAATIPELYKGIHAGIVVALLMVALTYIVMNKTRLGFEITFVGSNAEAADQAGMSRYKAYLVVFLVGGAFAGLAGISEIAGAQSRFRAAFSPGFGFTAIPIALLGRNGALQVTLAALFFSVLFVGGQSVEIVLGVESSVVEIIQALIILFLITAEFFKSYRVSLRFDRGSSTTPAQPQGGDD